MSQREAERLRADALRILEQRVSGPESPRASRNRFRTAPAPGSPITRRRSIRGEAAGRLVRSARQAQSNGLQGDDSSLIRTLNDRVRLASILDRAIEEADTASEGLDFFNQLAEASTQEAVQHIESESDIVGQIDAVSQNWTFQNLQAVSDTPSTPRAATELPNPSSILNEPRTLAVPAPNNNHQLPSNRSVDSDPSINGPRANLPLGTGPPRSGPPRNSPPESGPPGSGPPRIGPPRSGPTESGPPRSVPSGSVPTGSGPPRSVPSGSVPPRSVPSGSVPSGSVPSGSVPSGSVPSGSVPSGSGPPRSVPSGSVPSGSVPSGSVPSGSVPPGSGPSESGPPRSVPSGSVPSGSVPPGSGPSESVPPRSVPSGSVPSGSVPPGSGPTGSGPSGSGPPGSGPPGDGPPESATSRDNDDTPNCSICLQILEIDKKCQVLPCGHEKFHTHCVVSTFNLFRENIGSNFTRERPDLPCPYCRQHVTRIKEYIENEEYVMINATHRWPPNQGGTSRGVPRGEVPPPPSFSDEPMRDRTPTPVSAPRVTRPGVAPLGFVYDKDRSDPSSKILKKVIGVFSARNRGHRLLLESSSRNTDYPELLIYDLEAQSRFPGKMREWQEENGAILQTAPRINFEGRNWENFVIMGVADVWQNIRTVDGRVQMPKIPAESIVSLHSRDDEIEVDWYKVSDVNAEFGSDKVRRAIHDHRLKTGQHEPITPQGFARRRGQPRPNESTPLSDSQELPERGRRHTSSQARPLYGEDLEDFYERQLRILRERRAASETTRVPFVFYGQQEPVSGATWEQFRNQNPSESSESSL